MIPSLICLGAGISLCGIAPTSSRKAGTLAVVLGFATLSWLIPFPEILGTGDSSNLSVNYAPWPPGGIRFEAHLSYFLIHVLYHVTGIPAGDPRPVLWLCRAAELLFLAELLIVCVAYSWSSDVVRYAGLVLAGAAALMYFGYPELGYFSMSALPFPLLMKGGRWFDAAAAAIGFHAALHGFGLLGLAGAVAVVAVYDRARLVQLITLAVTAYLSWVMLYLIVLNVPLTPGHAEGIIFRPLLMPGFAERRQLDPLLSSRGVRDVIAGLTIAGATLLMTGWSKPAALFTVPSLTFAIWWWPIQGMAIDSDLVLAGFPAVFALMWASARSTRRTACALALLAVAHTVYWWVVHNEAFINQRAPG